jgi:hypothetical protein
MDTTQAKSKLYTLIRARAPIIGIETAETRRFTEALVDIIDQDEALSKRRGQPRKELFSFSVTRGLNRVATKTGEFSTQDGTPMLIYAEQQIAPPGPDPAFSAYSVTQQILENDAPTPDGKGNLPRIYILKDVHPYFEDNLFVRGLRDLAEALIKRSQTVILISPDLGTLPAVLQKDVKILAWPLPGADELEQQIDSFCHNLSATQVSLNGQKSELINALKGLTMTEADQVLAEAVITNGILDERAIGFTITAKAEIIRQSGALEFYPPETSLGDVGGLDNFKDWLRKAGMTNSQKARDFGIKPARGVLVVGVPGCGKSLTAKAISQLWGVPVLKQDWGAMYGPLVGQSESQTRNTFRVAGAIGNCILWWDEIEKAAGSQGGERDGGTSNRILGTALTWMEEEAAQHGVFIYATANDIAQLRPEFIRRFTEVFFVDLPSPTERKEIFEIHLRKAKQDPASFDLTDVIGLTNGFTGAEIEETVQSGLWAAFAEERPLAVSDLEIAAQETVPLITTMREQVEGMRKWAERARPASRHQNTGRSVSVVIGGDSSPSRATALEM